jgi:uncharacterized membrane protein YgcG
MDAEQPAVLSQRAGLSPETRRRLLRTGTAAVAAGLYLAPSMRTTRLAVAAACISPAGVQLDAWIDTARCDLLQGRLFLRNNSASQRIAVREINAVLTFGGAARAAPEYAPALPAGADILLRPGVEVQPGQTAATALALNPAGLSGAGRTAVVLTATIRYNAGSARLECSTDASLFLDCPPEGNGGGDNNGNGGNGGNGGGGNGGSGSSQRSQQQPPPQAVPPPLVPSSGQAQPVTSPLAQAAGTVPQPQVSVLAGGQPEALPLPGPQVSSESLAPAPQVAAQPPTQASAPASVPAPAQVPPLAVPLPAAAAPPPAPASAPPAAGSQAAGPAPRASPASQPSVTLPRAGASASSPAAGVRSLGIGALLLALGRLFHRLAGRRGGPEGGP